MRKITGEFPSKTKTLKIEFFWFECHSAEKRNAVCILTTNHIRLSCAHFTPLNNTEMSLSRKTNIYTLTKHMAGWHVLSSNRKNNRRDSSVQRNTAHLGMQRNVPFCLFPGLDDVYPALLHNRASVYSIPICDKNLN